MPMNFFELMPKMWSEKKREQRESKYTGLGKGKKKTRKKKNEMENFSNMNDVL